VVDRQTPAGRKTARAADHASESDGSPSFRPASSNCCLKTAVKSPLLWHRAPSGLDSDRPRRTNGVALDPRNPARPRMELLRPRTTFAPARNAARTLPSLQARTGALQERRRAREAELVCPRDLALRDDSHVQGHPASEAGRVSLAKHGSTGDARSAASRPRIAASTNSTRKGAGPGPRPGHCARRQSTQELLNRDRFVRPSRGMKNGVRNSRARSFANLEIGLTWEVSLIFRSYVPAPRQTVVGHSQGSRQVGLPEVVGGQLSPAAALAVEAH